MSENTNELAVIDSSANLGSEIANLSSGQLDVFTTIQGEDFAAKLATLSAVSDSEPIQDNLNKTIHVANIVIQKVDMLDEESGELKAQPRVILIDKDGKAYHGISTPLYRDVKNWLSMLGMPSGWPAPLPVKIARAGSGTRQYFTAKLAK